MAATETIKVHHPDNENDWMLINKSDFDARVHRKYSAKRKKSQNKDEAKAARIAELEKLYDDESYRAIADLAATFNPPIEKPESGWRDAIPLIVDREFS